MLKSKLATMKPTVEQEATQQLCLLRIGTDRHHGRNSKLFPTSDIAVRMAASRAVVMVVRIQRQRDMPRRRMCVRRKCICDRKRRGHGIDDESASANLHCHRGAI